MSRVRRGNKRLLRRKKILKQAKGYWGTKSKLHKAAKQQVLRSLAYAYRTDVRRRDSFAGFGLFVSQQQLDNMATLTVD